MAEWSVYNFEACGNNWDSARLENVFHIAHIKQAQQILSEGEVLARVIYDESRLNKTRVHVVWMSPNHWTNGSFYGNIRFHFDWDRLIQGKKIYWVESIEYSPHAPRFLVTARDPKALGIASYIQRYDPSQDDGPIKTLAGRWYFNQKVTLELMVEENINLKDCVRVDVIKHHDRICRIHKSSCRELRREYSRPGAELLGYLIGSDCHLIDAAMTSDIGLPDHRRYHNDLIFPVAWLDGQLSKGVNFGGPINSKKDAKRLIRAAALQLAVGQRERAKSLISLIASHRVYDKAIEETIQDHFGLEGVNLLLR